MNINNCHVVASTNQAYGRTYINLIGKDASFAGDRNYKIWTDGTKINFEKGKGTLSPAFEASLEILKDLNDKGVFASKSQAEINYDNLHNEGGEGYNPHRDTAKNDTTDLKPASDTTTKLYINAYKSHDIMHGDYCVAFTSEQDAINASFDDYTHDEILCGAYNAPDGYTFKDMQVNLDGTIAIEGESVNLVKA